MGTGNDVKPITAPSVKFTYEDFLNFPDDGNRHEIIDGEHYVTPSPNTKHQAVSASLAAIVWTYLKHHPIGAVFAAPFDVVFSDLSVVEPDLLYISRERAGILTDKHVRGAPDLVVEILSPGTRKTDEITKRKLYERFDVREYWVVDPELDAVKVYRRDGGVFVRAAELTSGLSSLKKDQIAERGARLARRDDRGYREYLREEQRRQAGCPAREVVLDQRGQATNESGDILTTPLLPDLSIPLADLFAMPV